MRDGALKSLGAHATAQDAARAYARECSVAHGGRPDERASARGAQVPGFHAHSLGPASPATDGGGGGGEAPSSDVDAPAPAPAPDPPAAAAAADAAVAPSLLPLLPAAAAAAAAAAADDLSQGILHLSADL